MLEAMENNKYELMSQLTIEQKQKIKESVTTEAKELKELSTHVLQERNRLTVEVEKHSKEIEVVRNAVKHKVKLISNLANRYQSLYDAIKTGSLIKLQLQQRQNQLLSQLEAKLTGKMLRQDLEARPAQSAEIREKLEAKLASVEAEKISADAKRLQDQKDAKDIPGLLEDTYWGRQDKIEGIVRQNPRLLSIKGNCTDLSKRQFNGITAFQYAWWACDWYMWRMMIKYMDKAEVLRQVDEIESNTLSWVSCAWT